MKVIPGRHTFRHRFSDGTTCEITVTLTGGIVAAKWSRRPKPSREFIEEYCRWQREVLQILADDSGQSIVQAILTGPGQWTTISARPRTPVPAGGRAE
jgi:hypothetical protein